MPEKTHTVYTPPQGSRTYIVEHNVYGVSVYIGNREIFIDLFPEEGVQIKTRQNPEEGGGFDLVETFYEE